MARALIVGCGCRGRELGARLLAEGWAVRGTSRREAGLAAIHGPRLERLMEHLVETPVRGVLYEGTEEGVCVVEAASRTWRLPARTVTSSLAQPSYSAAGDGLAGEVKALLAGESKELNSDGNSGN